MLPATLSWPRRLRHSRRGSGYAQIADACGVSEGTVGAALAQARAVLLEAPGIGYTAVGFRSRGGMICSALVDPAAKRANGGVGCASARLLRRSLEEQRFFVSGGGGGRHAITHGFARAGVTGLALAADERPGAVELSKPWRPGRGKPIRFFYAISDAPAEHRPRVPYQRIIEERR